MHTKMFNIKLNTTGLELKNLSDDKSDYLLEVVNNFNSSVIFSTFSIKKEEVINFTYINDNFYHEWIGETFFIKIYDNKNQLIYNKTLSIEDKKCYICFSNKKFEPLVIKLLEGLTKYSDVQVFHYSINYKSNINFNNVTNIEFNVDGNIKDNQFMQFIKPLIFLDVLEKDYTKFVFLDADVQVKPNIDDVFNYFQYLKEGPILQKASWEYTLVWGDYVPGPLLTKYFDLEGQMFPQGVTNIVLFNKNHKALFKKWKSICFSEEINEIRKKEFLHDELLLNCLMWKSFKKPTLFNFLVNVLSLEDVKFVYNSPNLKVSRIDMNDYSLGHSFQSFIPHNKEQILGFHCVKDIQIANDINNYILNMNNKVVNLYDNSIKIVDIIKSKKPLNFNVNFVDGAFLEILGNEKDNYRVLFINNKTHEVIHSDIISNNMWVKTSKKYFIDYNIKVYNSQNELVFEHNFDAKNKRVYISLESSSLGDTLAWFPYIEEFRKKHNCELICSTFNNEFFKTQYPNIEFIKPGTKVFDLYAMYRIGWFYDGNEIDLSKNVSNFRNKPLQQTSSDILGLEYVEIKPKIDFIPSARPIEQKYVVIAPHASAHAKYWNYPGGWQQIIDYLKSKGYEVMMITREEHLSHFHNSKLGGQLKGIIDKTGDKSLKERMNQIYHADLFIGIGSGLTWLSWVLNIPTIMISGFSSPYTEMQGIERIFVPDNSICNSCFNRHKLDPSDWEWCPDHKNTDRQFECTKTITPEIVKTSINKLIN